MHIYTKHLSEPWFSLIKIGVKTCEGRLNTGDFAEMKKDDIIIFTNNDFDFPRTVHCIITSTHEYGSFVEYLMNETLEKCLPGIDKMEDGVGVYHKYYKNDEEKYKIKAFHITVLPDI